MCVDEKKVLSRSLTPLSHNVVERKTRYLLRMIIQVVYSFLDFITLPVLSILIKINQVMGDLAASFAITADTLIAASLVYFLRERRDVALPYV